MTEAIRVVYAYSLVLLAGYLLLPGVVLARGNSFRSGAQTFLRAVAATALAWLWLIASVVTGTQVAIWLADSVAEVDAIVDGDGAKYAATLLFGWVPSLVVVVGSWAVIRLWRAAGRIRKRRTTSEPLRR